MTESLNELVPKFKVNETVWLNIDGTSRTVRLTACYPDADDTNIWYEIDGEEGIQYHESAFDHRRGHDNE